MTEEKNLLPLLKRKDWKKNYKESEIFYNIITTKNITERNCVEVKLRRNKDVKANMENETEARKVKQNIVKIERDLPIPARRPKLLSF